MSDGLLYCCPACGHALSDALDVKALQDVPLPKMPRRLLDALVAAHPRPVRKDALIDAMYWDDGNGGAESASNAVSVQLVRLRLKLWPTGWTVSTGHNEVDRRGTYRLVKAIGEQPQAKPRSRQDVQKRRLRKLERITKAATAARVLAEHEDAGQAG